MEEFVRSTVRLDAEFQERVRIAIAKRRLRSFQAAVEQALQQWMESSDVTKNKPAMPIPPAEPSEWHRKLTEILKSGDQAMIAAVTQNIDVSHDRMRPSRRKRAG